MATVHSESRPVKAERPPYRPLLRAPQAAYWADDAGAFHVLLSGRRKADAYELIALSTDIGGVAFRWFKQGGESYDVLVSGVESSCSCAGWAYANIYKPRRNCWKWGSCASPRTRPAAATRRE